MKITDIPNNVKEKIFEIKLHSDQSVFKIISYFPLSDFERQTITSLLNQPNFSEFHSIFTDNITDDEWNRTKSQIKKRFQDEIFHIDN